MSKLKIAISTESTVDLSKEFLTKHNIKVIPLGITIGDKEGFDGELSAEEIVAYADSHKELPKTCAVNEFRYEEFFEGILTEYDAIIHISLSSTLSSCYQNAINASKKFKNVHIIDSMTLSSAIGLLCVYASTLVEKGLSIDEIVKKVDARKQYAEASFYLETIDYLYKGGRCSAVAAIGARILRIRPQIIVNAEGKMELGSVFFGKKSDIAKSYVNDVFKKFKNPDKSLIMLTHSVNVLDTVIDTVYQMLLSKGFKNIYINEAGSTIISHCGPGSLGILFFNDGVETL